LSRSNAGARLSAYLEGDLSEAERSKVESRLADDPELRETLRELEDVVALVRALPEPELPPAFSTRVIARVQEQGERAPGGILGWIQRLIEPAVAVPLAAGITALALFIGSQQGISPAAEPAGGDWLAAVADRPHATSPAAARQPSPQPAPTRLARQPVDTGSMALSEIQRRTLQTILSRNRHEDLAALLRGSGHPHAASFASQVVEVDPNLQVVSLEQRRARR